MNEPKPQSVTAKVFDWPIRFEKTPQFRSVYSNGVWFGSDPQGNVHLIFYNDRSQVPEKLSLKLNEKGEVVNPDELAKTPPGAVREMEVNIIFSPQLAVKFHHALGENLEALRKAGTL